MVKNIKYVNAGNLENIDEELLEEAASQYSF